MKKPLLPLRDTVLFPHMAVPLFVGRQRSIQSLDQAMLADKSLVLVAQRHPKTAEPSREDLYDIGTMCTIVQLLRLPDGTVKLLVEGNRRVRLLSVAEEAECLMCEVEQVTETQESTTETHALMRSVASTYEVYAKLNPHPSTEPSSGSFAGIDDPARLVDTVAGHLVTVKLQDRQAILENLDVNARLENVLSVMTSEIEILQVEKKIRSRVKKQMERTQKEYYLNEQMQAIQRELGERDEFRNEIRELEEQIRGKKLSKEADEKIRRELKKLKLMPPMTAEATVVRNYIDWIVSLPWQDVGEENYDLEKAKRILDEDHYGLKKIKERIVEYLAVQALVKKLKGPILCFVGPPGVGKTSLARSVARATGREFVRLSLGGVRDEAEIRGHRRTYIGALPGRIIQCMRKVGVGNPVFLLDEVDKMSSDFRGDPAAALLEVLDPEQNNTFNDHYLELDYDLSNVMFITTANTLSGIPLPLQDRMEVIQVSGYTEYEKKHIAAKYLVPRQKVNAGLENVEVDFKPSALRMLINRYTRESGVRNLEREIGSICRKIARDVVTQTQTTPFHIDATQVRKYLGPTKIWASKPEGPNEIGLAQGLAYTQFGGATLECEVTVVPGKGKLVITGLLEKGMQESAQAAMSYIRSRQHMLGLEDDFYHKNDVHIHFPEFVPKDGPSAGITMAACIASAFLKVPVRKTVAMTGEITLRGRIMPIGGLKEKLLAARRADIKTVLIPKENRKDLSEIPKVVVKSLRIVLVEHMDQVLFEALDIHDPEAYFRKKLPKPWEVIAGELIKHGLEWGQTMSEDTDRIGVPAPSAAH